MRRWWDRLFVLIILGVAAGSIYAIWPDEPDRYFPDWMNLPSGRGVPSEVIGIDLPCKSDDADDTNDAANCKGMILGLDLQGGSRIVLEADLQGQPDIDLNDAMGAAKSIIENRINPFGVSEAQVQRSGDNRLIVELPGVSADTAQDITRPAVFMFCEPLQQDGKPGEIQGDAASLVATSPRAAEVYYKPGSCEPDVADAEDCAAAPPAAGATTTAEATATAAEATATSAGATATAATASATPAADSSGCVIGSVALKGPDGGILLNAAGEVQRITPQYGPSGAADRATIIWTPALGSLGGAPTVMTGGFLESNATVQPDQFGTFNNPLLVFNMTDDGSDVFGSLTERIQPIGQTTPGMPLATFLDGEPIRGREGQIIAPEVNAEIRDTGVTSGLTLADAKRLREFLNNGAFPIPLRVVQQQDVDASLGDEAVLESVQAGIVAILIIMAFMTLYYRLPGVLASAALVVYTGVVLAIFKIGIPFPTGGLPPVTLTLAGVAAFVLSIGLAVDANILIFERTKEELRNGRSLLPAVATGFDRAWTSIRDSNVSTLITCAILYFMGDQFGSTQIKGFALTLAIGVLVSLFSAITVTRTFLRLATATPLRHWRWLWTDDKIEDAVPQRARAAGSAAEPADA
jgi:protein-export membrane protein SecD